MATSDNVLRAGLTPKLRDVPNLISSLTYKAGDPTIHLIQPSVASFSTSRRTKIYDPPVPEFSVCYAAVTVGEKESHEQIDGPSLVIITSGSGRIMWTDTNETSLALKEGSVIFIAAKTPVSFEGDMTFFRAFVEA